MEYEDKLNFYLILNTFFEGSHWWSVEVVCAMFKLQSSHLFYRASKVSY